MSDIKETSAHGTRELLLRYMDKSLEDEEKAEVEDLVDNNDEALRELQEIEALTAIIRDNGVIFCPDPLEISNFLEHGRDPTGKLSEHLQTCKSCQEDVALLKTSRLRANMPQDLLRSIVRELPERTTRASVDRTRGGVHTILDRILSYFRFGMPAVGAVALAFMVILVVYHRDSITQVIGKNSVAWNRVVNGLLANSSNTNSLRKPNVAIILRFEDTRQPLSHERRDALYNTLKPAKEDLERYQVIAPSQVSRIIAENKLKTSDVDGIVCALRQERNIREIVVVTIRGSDDRFNVRSTLIKASTGQVVQENATEMPTYSELKSGLRQIAYSVLSNKK
jgi:hypothetical protein